MLENKEQPAPEGGSYEIVQYLLSWFNISFNVFENRLQVVFISHTQIFNLDFPLLGPVFWDLRRVWNGYSRIKQNKCYQKVTSYDSSFFPPSFWTPSWNHLRNLAFSFMPNTLRVKECLLLGWHAWAVCQGISGLPAGHVSTYLSNHGT